MGKGTLNSRADALWTVIYEKPPRIMEDYDFLTLVALITQKDMLKHSLEGEGPIDYDLEHWTTPIVVEETGDPLADEWERDIASGRIPDLDK